MPQGKEFLIESMNYFVLQIGSRRDRLRNKMSDVTEFRAEVRLPTTDLRGDIDPVSGHAMDERLQHSEILFALITFQSGLNIILTLKKYRLPKMIQ